MKGQMKRWNSECEVFGEGEEGLGEVVLSKKKEGAEPAALIGWECSAAELTEVTNEGVLFGVSRLGSGAPSFGA